MNEHGSMAEYGPDNPRDWNPNHPMLTSPYAPHETAAVLRFQRSGLRGTALMKACRLKGTQLMKKLEQALADEKRAEQGCRPIHDARVKAGTE